MCQQNSFNLFAGYAMIFVNIFYRGILTKTETRKTLNYYKIYPKQNLFGIIDLKLKILIYTFNKTGR